EDAAAAVGVSSAAGVRWFRERGGMGLAFGQACGKAGVARSMSSRGDCFDNAVAESFFATLKKELIRRQSWPTRAELRQAVFEYIELFYNATRRHSTLGFLSPAEYERISPSPDQED
ncbi:MAG: IS3 family transposase, partial [Solirubrobacteraceae bacterium]